MNKEKIIIAVLIVFAFIINVEASKKYKLGYNLEIGKTYKLKTITDQSFTQTIQDKKQTYLNRTTSVISYKAIGKEKGCYVLDVTYDSLEMISETPNGRIIYSIKEPVIKEDIISVAFRRIIGVHIQIKMLPNGHITGFSYLNNFIDSIMKEYNDSPKDLKEFIRANLENNFGVKTLTSSFETVTAIFPDKKTAISGKWQKTLNLESYIKMIQNTTYTLHKIEGFNATILDTAQIIQPPKNDYVKMYKYYSKHDITGTQTSIITIDSQTGWIKKGSSNQRITGKMTIRETMETPETIEIPIEIVTYIQYSGL